MKRGIAIGAGGGGGGGAGGAGGDGAEKAAPDVASIQTEAPAPLPEGWAEAGAYTRPLFSST